MRTLIAAAALLLLNTHAHAAQWMCLAPGALPQPVRTLWTTDTGQPPRDDADPCTWQAAPPGAQQGWIWDGKVFAPPPPRVPTSVLPAPWRRAMRATPSPVPGVTAMDWLLAKPMTEDQRDAIDYAVRIERDELIRWGVPAALADTVLLLAATYAGSAPAYAQ